MASIGHMLQKEWEFTFIEELKQRNNTESGPLIVLSYASGGVLRLAATPSLPK